MPHRRRQIGRPDEHRIHPVHCGDLGDAGNRVMGFHLDDQAQFLFRADMIVRNQSVDIGPRHARNAADAARRIAHGRHRRPRLERGLNVRDHQGLRPQIQQPLDQDRVVAGGPDNGAGAIGCHGLHHPHRVGHVGQGMFGVDHHPVEPRRRQRLDRDGTGNGVPYADLLPAVLQGPLEPVDGHHLAPTSPAIRRSASRYPSVPNPAITPSARRLT